MSGTLSLLNRRHLQHFSVWKTALLFTVLLLFLFLISGANVALAGERPLGWYYDTESGDWFYELSTDGTARKRGWHEDVDGYRYYLDPMDGRMHAGYSTIGGVEYCFRPERNQGNYHQDALGAWYYRANGRIPYGALISSDTQSRRGSSGGSGGSSSRDSGSSGDASSDDNANDRPASVQPETEAAAEKPDAGSKTEPTSRDPGLVDSDQLVTDRITIPEKASPSEIKREDSSEETKPSGEEKEKDEKASPSEIPDARPSETVDPEESASPSEIPKPEETPLPEETASPSELPKPEPSDEHIHTHDEDRSVPCIARDSWDTISAHPEQYHDCIENRCTARLDLSGAEIAWPFSAESKDTQQYPCYVSLIDNSEGLLFAQAYALPELSDVPMHIGLSPHGASGTFIQTNQGGIPETWLYSYVNGTEAGDPFIFYLEEADGVRGYSSSYAGYRLIDPESGKELPVTSMKKYLSRGFSSEQPRVEETYYKKLYLDGNASEEKLPQLTSRSAALWLPAEQEVVSYTLSDAREQLSYGMYLKSDTYLPALSDSWRSEEAYWLRTLPSAYHTEEQFEDMGMTDASERNRYFLRALADGTVETARYDDTAALRLMFRIA